MALTGDVVIVGAGPAGISAAIYLCRAGLYTMLFEEGTPGGLLRQARCVENYPGFPDGMSGRELANRLWEHLLAVGGICHKAKVNAVSRCVDGSFMVDASGVEHRTRAVILATGTEARRIEIIGTEPLEGLRVFYDLDALLEVAKPPEKIVVYGGGDTAFDEGLSLRDRGHEVTIVCRSRARCLPLLRSRAGQSGMKVVEGQTILRVNDGNRPLLELSGDGPVEVDRLLVACGRVPRTDLLVPFNAPGHGAHIKSSVPSVPGLYLAGDVLAGDMRQVGIAVGSGITAAMLAERFLRKGRE